MEKTEQLLNERGQNYGSYEFQAERGQNIRREMHIEEMECPAYIKDALGMLAVKLSRITFGNPYHLDSWKDIAGYATLVADILEAKDETNG